MFIESLKSEVFRYLSAILILITVRDDGVQASVASCKIIDVDIEGF